MNILKFEKVSTCILSYKQNNILRKKGYYDYIINAETCEEGS